MAESLGQAVPGAVALLAVAAEVVVAVVAGVAESVPGRRIGRSGTTAATRRSSRIRAIAAGSSVAETALMRLIPWTRVAPLFFNCATTGAWSSAAV